MKTISQAFRDCYLTSRVTKLCSSHTFEDSVKKEPPEWDRELREEWKKAIAEKERKRKLNE